MMINGMTHKLWRFMPDFHRLREGGEVKNGVRMAQAQHRY